MSLNACAPKPDLAEPDRQDFVELLPVIQSVVRHVCVKARLTVDDQNEFTSIVMLKLMENDYAVLRAFRGASGLRTYLYAVVRRCLLDVRIKEWGKWRPSRLARRLGPLATMLERLVIREGLPMREAVPTLRHHPGFMVTSSDVWRLRDVLPARTPRYRQVDLRSDLDLGGPQRADVNVQLEDLARGADCVRNALGSVLASLSAEDRKLLRLRFQQNLSVARIAELTDGNATVLYRRLAALLKGIRVELTRRGLTATDVRPLLGHAAVDLEGLFPGSRSNP